MLYDEIVSLWHAHKKRPILLREDCGPGSGTEPSASVTVSVASCSATASSVSGPTPLDSEPVSFD
jgi:hypothetical protein